MIRLSRQVARKLRQDQRGAVAITAGLGLVVVLGAAALAVDGGYLYSLRAQL